MSQRLDQLLDELVHDEPADVAVERSPGVTEVRIGPATIARIDERRSVLVVYAPADVRWTLQAEYPGARPDPDGVTFDLANAEQAAEGFGLLRRRAQVQRLGSQYRERSP